MVEFSWDRAKAASNRRKHGVSFEEACTVFCDDFAVQFFDREHSDDENRFLLLGMSSTADLLLVSHCERDRDLIRIISARRATRRESEYYVR